MENNKENKFSDDEMDKIERKQEINILKGDYNEKNSLVSELSLSISEILELEMAIVMKLRTNESYEHEFVSKGNQLAKIIEKNRI